MIVADASQVAKAAPYAELVETLRRAFAAGDGVCAAPTRSHHAVPAAGRAERTLLSMPAWGPDGDMVVKLALIVPDNPGRGAETVQAQVLVGEAGSGRWTALLDGGELTARRTAAASALAAGHLARPEASTLFMVGAGRMSRHLIAAHAAVRPIRRVLVWSRREATAEQVVAWAREQGFEAATADLAGGAAEAHVISCATLASAPLILGTQLRPGVHLDLVGAFRPEMRETDAEAVGLAEVFVDTRAGAEAEAGDLIQATAEGAFNLARIRADLHELCAGAHPGRESDEEITLFKSVGAAIEDYAAARMVVERLA